MTLDEPPSSARQAAGLCFDCRYARCIESARGSLFRRCDRARHDDRLSAYPELPRQQCHGYESVNPDAPAEEV